MENHISEGRLVPLSNLFDHKEGIRLKFNCECILSLLMYCTLRVEWVKRSLDSLRSLEMTDYGVVIAAY